MKLKHLILAITIPVTFSAFAWTAAWAEVRNLQAPFHLSCGPTGEVYELLKTEYNEEPSFMAFTESRSAIVWFTNDTASTFSLVKDDMDGTSCIFWGAKCEPGECLQPGVRIVTDMPEIMADIEARR